LRNSEKATWLSTSAAAYGNLVSQGFSKTSIPSPTAAGIKRNVSIGNKTLKVRPRALYSKLGASLCTVLEGGHSKMHASFETKQRRNKRLQCDAQGMWEK